MQHLFLVMQLVMLRMLIPLIPSFQPNHFSFSLLLKYVGAARISTHHSIPGAIAHTSTQKLGVAP